MAWNFRRRKKIAPGVYINMSKKGISTTIGPKGASMTFGPNGTYLNTSLPGTGMYNRRKLSSTSSSPAPQSNINFTNHVPRKNTGRPLILVLFIIFNSLFLADLVAAEFELFYEICGINDGKIFLLGNIGLAFFGIILICIRHSVQKRQSVFSYKREKRNAQKVLDSLSFNDKDMRNILKAYIQCLTINEEFEKEQEIIEELKKSTDQKALDLIPIHEARAEALKVNLEKMRYNADADLSDEQKQSFKLFVDSFEILSNSDKIWFETGITSRNLIQREETKFEFGVFDYIKSEFEIPVIRIPQTSINFYIYPHFIIRSESTTIFRIYPIEKVDIEYSAINFREEYKPNVELPKDATLISSGFLYETTKGEPDRRYAYNPLYVTYDYGKLTIPRFGSNWSLNFYVSNRDSAKHMQEAYINFKESHQNDESKNSKVINSYGSQLASSNFKNTISICDDIYNFRNELSKNQDFINILKNKKVDAITGLENDNWLEVIDILILCDLCHCYTNLVDPVKNFKDKEYRGYLYLVHLLQTGEKIDTEHVQSERFYTLHEEERLIFNTFTVALRNNISGTLLISSLLVELQKDTQLRYCKLIYRLLSATANIDSTISKQEDHFLNYIMFDIKSIDYKADETDNVTLPEKWHKLANEKYNGNYNLIHLARRLVELQKCVITDICAELQRDRMLVMTLIEILEDKGIIQKDGRKRIITVANEEDLFLKLDTTIEDDSIEEVQLENIDIPYPYDPMVLDVAKFVVLQQEGTVAAIQRYFAIGFNRAGKIAEQLEQLGVYGPNRTQEGYDVLVKDLQQLQDVLSGRSTSSRKNITTSRTRTKSHTSELDKLVGLASVKEEIKTLSNFIKIQQKRKEQGLKSSSVSYHCVFTGNPGTGKTTVARIVAQIYKDLGILSKGHLVETDRAGLVAEYVGQTAVKTNKIIDSALDGVLFIDEAYSLIGTGQDYGKEAIATLLKRMEDNRDRLVVILAGYSKEMQDFINTNPGLQSRFNRYIDFPDYSAEELLQIFEKNVEKFDYKLQKEALVAMSEYFQHAVENKDANFGNARFVRNIFEKTLEKQANRLSTDPDLDTEELTLITKEDLPIE